MGDLVFGVLLFASTGSHTVARTATFAAAVTAVAILLTGFLVFHGLAGFFIGRSEGGEAWHPRSTSSPAR